MQLPIRSESIKQTEREMVKDFCDRYSSSMIRKSPEEVINMFLDWQYERFKVRDDADLQIFTLYDFKTFQPVMILDKRLPGAYQCIHNFCEELNAKTEEELEDHEMKVDFMDFLNSFKICKGEKE